MKEKLKAFVKNNEEEIEAAITGAIVSTVVMVTFIYGCRMIGYEMVTPVTNSDGGLSFKTFGGKMLKIRVTEQ